MTEKEALKQMKMVCDMMITCIESGLAEKSEQYAKELHQSYRTWFDAWRNNDYNQHR